MRPNPQEASDVVDGTLVLCRGQQPPRGAQSAGGYAIEWLEPILGKTPSSSGTTDTHIFVKVVMGSKKEASLTPASGEAVGQPLAPPYRRTNATPVRRRQLWAVCEGGASCGPPQGHVGRRRILGRGARPQRPLVNLVRHRSSPPPAAPLSWPCGS